MSFETFRNKMVHEQRIKNHLSLIDFEQPEDHHLNSRHLYDLHASLKRKNSNQHDITDWMNNHKSAHLVKTSKKQADPSSPDYKKLLVFDSTRYQSSLLSKTSSKNKRIELSPIAIKFNAKLLSHNLQRSRQDFLQKLREDPYLTHYKSISSRKNCERQSPKVKQLQIPLGQTSPSKNQRTFGLLYLLKRRDSMKLPKKRNNPQDLTVCHCKMF